MLATQHTTLQTFVRESVMLRAQILLRDHIIKFCLFETTACGESKRKHASVLISSVSVIAVLVILCSLFC